MFEKAEYNEQTLKLLLRNSKELENAESRILEAIAVDCLEGKETHPFVTEKLFEISELIMQIGEQIRKCKKEIRKNKK